MAAIVLPDGQSWVVSGETFRRLLATLRQSIPPTEERLLASLDAYEAVKGISLDLLDLADQRRLADLLVESARRLVTKLNVTDDPRSKPDLPERLDELQRLLQQRYGHPRQ